MADSELTAAVARVEEEKVLTLVRERLGAGVASDEVLSDCNRGMVELGERFGRGEAFLPELMFGGMIMKKVMAELGPTLSSEGPSETLGKVVMGSVQHDVHDIGKDIVVTMLRGVGFEVVDLGINVSPEQFVEAVREHQPTVLGMSVLLTTCFKSVIATVNAIEEAGLRDGLSLMVGGAAASDLLAENAGCDFYGKTAIDGVKFVTSAVEAA